MKAFVVLGNQLFPTEYLKDFKSYHFFMAEDYGLCSFVKHHKQKILLYLTCMREYRDKLIKEKFKISYLEAENKNFKETYETKLLEFLKKNNIKEVQLFEIEDIFFEKRLVKFFQKNTISFTFLRSPMFLTSRSEFKDYLQKSKKPFMANFYKDQRIRLNILINSKQEPLGGKWSFDEENRKKLAHKINIPIFKKFKSSRYLKNIKDIILKHFDDHPGSLESFNYPTSRDDVVNLLDGFLDEKISNFGDYEDSITQQSHTVFHSVLSPFLNLGLIVPKEVVYKTISFCNKKKIKINNLEGFVRQIIGWREFMRGIYKNYEDELLNKNFFKHKRKMKNTWYTGSTNIPPLDHSIKNCLQYGYVHHIERLMVLANIMNLSEIEPMEVYRWFMEMFVDSSDWVMAPNVMGMGLFSDGGIFATKPYICGSSYILKMSDFKRGGWCEVMDGLYWRFIDKNRNFFSKNYRLAMMVKVFDKMDKVRKAKILSLADDFIKKNTN
jgi:deoxyribodipyrimidine photolyase-related protein